MKKIEEAIVNIFSEEMNSDEQLCKDIYSALTNIIWMLDGEEHSVSFRTAGAIISSILNNGCYLDWYCCQLEGEVTDYISNKMELEGWTWKNYDT